MWTWRRFGHIGAVESTADIYGSHANDTTNYMYYIGGHRGGKRYSLKRNGFKGSAHVSMHNFEEVREIIIEYELPLREAHHSACP